MLRPDRSEGEAHRDGARQPVEGLVRSLLQVPLYWKILLANATLIAAAVTAVVLIVGGLPEVRAAPRAVLVGGSVALALSLVAAVNALIVRLALRPLWELEEAAEKVRGGDLEARAPDSPVADRKLEELIGTFNEMLDRLAEERERRRRLAVEALRAEDRARRQFAAALQEDTAQQLAAHVLRLRQIQEVESTVRRDRLLSTARQEAVATLESVRRTARGIYPPELEDLGIAAALRAFARSASSSSTEVEVRSQGTTNALPEEQRVGLYRILQEALSNALHHSGANHVLVRITDNDMGIQGEVADDGRGFDPGAVRRDPATGLGLLAMRELAIDLGGELLIETGPGQGTRVEVSVGTLSEGSGTTVGRG